jgi:hypothetical protein
MMGCVDSFISTQDSVTFKKKSSSGEDCQWIFWLIAMGLSQLQEACV